MIDLSRDGDVRILTMDEGENRFDRESVAALHAAVDEVAATEGPCALVTTGTGKFFSNGLDLDWMLREPDLPHDFVDEVHRLFGRVLGLDVYTVAAVNGHAFAGGAMLAAAHDVTVMRSDRGYWCVPEVDLGLPFSEAMFAALAAHVPRHTLAEASLTGRRYTGDEAVTAGIAVATVPEDEVLPTAVALAAPMAAKNRDVLRAHKRLLFGDAIDLCLGGAGRLTAADELAIRRLQSAYGDAVTRRAWAELPAMFTPGATVELDLRDATVRTFDGGEAITGFIAASMERFSFFEFTLLNAAVDVERATARLYMCELRQDAETGRWTTAYGLYRDRYERHDGTWRFAHRRYSSLARTNPAGDGMLTFDVPAD